MRTRNSLWIARISPEGAADNSQGRKPLETTPLNQLSPNGATLALVVIGVAPLGLFDAEDKCRFSSSANAMSTSGHATGRDATCAPRPGCSSLPRPEFSLLSSLFYVPIPLRLRASAVKTQ